MHKNVLLGYQSVLQIVSQMKKLFLFFFFYFFLTNKIKNYNPSFKHQYKKYLVPPKYWPVPNLIAEQWCLKTSITYEIFSSVTILIGYRSCEEASCLCLWITALLTQLTERSQHLPLNIHHLLKQPAMLRRLHALFCPEGTQII